MFGEKNGRGESVMQETLLEELFKEEEKEEKNENENNKLKSYALIDAAKITKLTNELIIVDSNQYQILFDGQEAIELEEVAPYLVELRKEEEFTKWVVKNVYGNNGAIFIKSSNNIETLAQDLKPFIPVTREVEYEGRTITQKGYLAYYDPRVFPDWISSVEHEKQEAFFRNIEAVYHEDMFNKSTLHIVKHNKHLEQSTKELY